MPRFTDAYDLFVFDLDGTLADTLEDIGASLNAALFELGRAPLALPAVRGLVGRGARVLLERALGVEAGAERVEKALGLFIEDYTRNCLRKTRLYPGVAETLEGLHGRGKRLAVLTNKPSAPAERIIEGLGAGHFFERIVGGDRMPRKKPDPSGLLDIMQAAAVSPARTLLVGDTVIDTATARAGGARSAWVPHGFQGLAPRDPPADHVLERFGDLADLPAGR